ncbi:type I restriction endonuclease subunit R [Rubritalea tangerina]|uniref:Type I restriction enzyme endonuclease subunit n=1 Tax=Rubritalea tangerina TaxID=430798 RepID=A0ABW4Z887_9BACT
MSSYTEDHLVEQPAIQILKDQLGWEYLNCYSESFGESGTLGRKSRHEVVLTSRLKAALTRLNPDVPADGINQAIDDLVLDRSALSLVEANREIYTLLKNGIKVKVTNLKTQQQEEKIVTVIDWKNPDNNDFFLTSQFWVEGEHYTRRTDCIGFVNGLPLALMEFKKPSVHIKEAYDKNLSDYKSTIPRLFHFNALILVSNGIENKVASVTAPWEHYNDWKKAASESETPETTLDNLLLGTCEASRLLDLIENFTLFSENKGSVHKLVARNHQFLGINRTVEALEKAEDHRVGVFWHTQGSGKSYSMVFFAEKVFRRIRGNWTFVVITDRTELDTQLYRTFATCGAAKGKECHASSSTHLRELLSQDHRYVFTLIHKFRTEPGTTHPILSERNDIIVLTDEAHRSQYDTMAMNMRTALPNAKFVAFTGTPLISGEERTKEVFGDYVSIYDFKQSVDDGATVPLFYENRTPELGITNPDLNEEIYEVIEDANLDDDQEQKLERVLGKKYHLITREDRLDTIAKDIVHHYLNRGYQGKAMVVSIDKPTTLKMYEKVHSEWVTERERVRERLIKLSPQSKDYAPLHERLCILNDTDMAVVVSPGQNEVEEMKTKHGIDILPHRERMNNEDLETKFKDPDDPFSLAFVCAMWLTGFDSPNCSTLYLDKPMKGHTLMQTIARANRTYGDKVNGLIVDYANVFQALEQALAIYGSGSTGGELPVKDKSELVEALKIALTQTDDYCKKYSIVLDHVMADPQKHFMPAVNALLKNDEIKDNYLAHAADVTKLYKAVMPDPIIPDLAPKCQVAREIAKAIQATKAPADITQVLQEIGNKLDTNIVSEAGLEPGEAAQTIDLSSIDFEALEKKFAKTNTKNTEAQKLRTLIEQKLNKLIRLNSSRYDYLERFERMIEEYNSGAHNIEELFKELVALSMELTEEEERHIREGLSEEELAVFDILTRPGPDLTDKETTEIKRVCRDMLAILKTEKLVLSWRQKRTARAAVRIAIEEMLDAGLPEAYTIDLFEAKCGALYQHVLQKYPDNGESIYNGSVA